MEARYLLTTLVAALSPVVAVAQVPVALDPIQTLQRINRNYNNVTDGCREPDTQAPRGHYYCSGVTLRMVDDGPFNPWDYSPYAIKTGATSFSWIRSDLSTNRMIRPAGFILRTPMDSRALDLPVMETGFTCIFSFDGYTGPERKWYGCGPYGKPLRADFMKNSKTSPSNRNEKFAYGTCDSSNIETADDWRRNYRYARTDMNRIAVHAERALALMTLLTVGAAPPTLHIAGPTPPRRGYQVPGNFVRPEELQRNRHNRVLYDSLSRHR
ncbi:hypothetical protein ACU5P1_11900 [Pseudomonas plecoglossicida]|uniref:hypothetical protein n=1 Tax=Pseudomonas plecoglossicida TaxID=70775 RepID=UPI000343E7EB|nr:hypothetical protein [Pseudomonas plecoglossicida]EPB96413.1 hypothetical protein L321_08315 [Pseudomonas plecoglossicida NB2011]